MLKTGNKPKKGFTLIEVMVATCVLSLGAVLVYQAFFLSLDSFNYHHNHLNALFWMDEKIWEAQDKLSHYATAADIEGAGNFTILNKEFNWSLSHNLIDQPQELYKIDLLLSWKEGKRQIRLSRSAYAIHKNK